jgi:hypothetical protein
VITDEVVVGIIAGAADFSEELIDLGREDVPVPQAVEEIVLAVLRAGCHPDAGGHHTGEKLGKLAEFEKTGVRVVRKIALRKHPEPQ